MFRKLATTCARAVVQARLGSRAVLPAQRVMMSSCPATPGFLGAPESKYTPELKFIEPREAADTYLVMDYDGQFVKSDYKVEHDDATLVDWYKLMIKINTMDNIFYDAQRQGRISFYMTAFGEEATHVGTASALDKDDVIFAQYREAGVLMYRGFTLKQLAHQCFSTHKDLGKGRQMPVHYGSRELNFQTISSPLGTQLPQAVGAAYALKRDKKPNVAVCYFGEGAASEGDFHAAMNFAVTLKAPVVFICRNNGYAISTPTREQYGGDGIVGRASGYGMKGIRVDGNDVFAVHEATKLARQYALENNAPILVELMSYRAGHHSTSDDSSRYRSVDEIKSWQSKNNPILRLRKYLERRNLWNEELETSTRDAARREVLEALNEAELSKFPPISQLFTDVYEELPHHLRDQREDWKAHLEKYAADYNLSSIYVDESEYVNPAPNTGSKQ